MKKIIILFSFLFVITAGNSQTQENFPLNAMHQGKFSNTVLEKKSGTSHPKTLTWKWDTIVTYDSLNNLRARFTQLFDANGNVISCIKENRQSNAWVNFYKEIYTYNGNGKVLQDLYQEWHTNAWVNNNLHTYTYDGTGNMLTDLWERWQSGTWVNFDKYTYTYNAGNIMTKLYEEWASNAWTNHSRDTYTYNASGIILSCMEESWQNNNTWQNSGRTSYTYNASGYLVTALVEGWNNSNSTWININHRIFTCDIFGNRLTNLYEQWQGNAWEPASINTYTYNSDNKMLSNLYQFWSNNTWENYYYNTFTYDGSGNLLTFIGEKWLNNAWVNYGKKTFTYDGNSNMLTLMNEVFDNNTWSPSGGFLSDYYQTDYSYDTYYLTYKFGNGHRFEASYSLLNSCSAYFYLYPDSITPHQYYAVNQAAGSPPLSYMWTWGDGSSSTTAYPNHVYDSAGYYNICLTITDAAGCSSTFCDSSQINKSTNSMISINVIPPAITGINEMNNAKVISVYPNPASSVINIDGISKATPVEIYDVSGKLLLSKQLTSHQLDISSLAKGFYFIKLITPQGNKVRKFVKD